MNVALLDVTDAAVERTALVQECLELAFPLDPGQGGRPAFAWAARSLTLPARTEERRGEDRAKMSVYRSATLHWRDRQGLCLIRNLSAGGMMCKLHAKLRPGQRVTVEMRSGHRIGGSIAWARDLQAGIHFDEPIDVHAVLNAPAQSEAGLRQRMPRLAIPGAGTLLNGISREPVTVLDVSQGGAKIEAALLRAGDEVTLAINGLDPHRGVVRWVKQGRAGIAFVRPIGFDALAQWALARQSATLQRVGTGSAPE